MPRRPHPVPAIAAAIVTALALAACASMPAAMSELSWQDQWGDRGRQVLVRDYAMCERLVEQRRGLMASCMAARGWTL